LRLVCAVATVPLLVTYQDDGRSAPWPMWPFAAGLFVAFMASNAASWRAQARAGGPGYRRWAGVQSGVDVIGVLFAVFAESYDPKANAWTALLLVGLVAALRAGSRAALATAAAGWAGLAAIVLGLGGLSGYAVSALVYSAMLLASVAAIAGGAVDRLMAAAAAAELAQQRLARQAGTDGLTGLANRLAFDAELARRWQDSAGPARVGLLVLDLNRFKEVNDRFGHAAGDELLQAVATRLASQLRPGDVLARLGGDEFAVILGDAHTELAACGAADRLAAGLLTPVTVPVADLELTATVSIGVAVSPAHAASPDGLLRAADTGMYRAKSAGRPVALYSAAGAQHERERRVLLGKLRSALEGGTLSCHYQPQVDLRGARTRRVEALVRWQHPERGLLGPGAFLPLAEQAGLMDVLTRQVLTRAATDAASWVAGGWLSCVSVNLAASDLLDPLLPADIAAILAAAGLPAAALQAEITETAFLSDLDRARSVLSGLRGLGIGVALDDFGTGYSSLTHLQQLPADELKLDQSFTARLATDPRTRAIVAGTITLAHTLGLRVVGERVEDQATHAELQALGCDLGQGYLYSPALPPGSLPGWLERSTPVPTQRHGTTSNVSYLPTPATGYRVSRTSR